MHMGEQRKNMKVQKKPIQLTIIEDDAKLVACKVQYGGEYALYVVEYQREELMNKLMEVKEDMEILKLNVTKQRRTSQHEPIHKEGDNP
jgi:hypothetical protein